MSLSEKMLEVAEKNYDYHLWYDCFFDTLVTADGRVYRFDSDSRKLTEITADEAKDEIRKSCLDAYEDIEWFYGKAEKAIDENKCFLICFGESSDDCYIEEFDADRDFEEQMIEKGIIEEEEEE